MDKIEEWNKQYAEHKAAEFAAMEQQQITFSFLAIVNAAFAYRLALLEEDDCLEEKRHLFSLLDALGEEGWWIRYKEEGRQGDGSA